MFYLASPATLQHALRLDPFVEVLVLKRHALIHVHRLVCAHQHRRKGKQLQDHFELDLSDDEQQCERSIRMKCVYRYTIRTQILNSAKTCQYYGKRFRLIQMTDQTPCG